MLPNMETAKMHFFFFFFKRGLLNHIVCDCRCVWVAIVTKTTTTNVHEDQHLVPSPEVSLVVTTTKHWARVSLFKHFTEETTVKSLLNIDNNSARGFIQLKIDSNGSNTVALRLKSEKAANLRLVINLGASVRINNQGSAVRSNHHHAVVQIQPGNKRIQKPLPRHTETINLFLGEKLQYFLYT